MSQSRISDLFPQVRGARAGQDLLATAVDMIAGSGFSSRALARHNRRQRSQAAFTIQSLFRRHTQRRRIRNAARPLIPVPIMPRRRRRRPRRGRKRRRSMRRSRRTSTRNKRRRRRSVVRHRLRLYPGGFPKTHLIKLRAVKQCLITSLPDAWGSIFFFPADPSDPFVGWIDDIAGALGNDGATGVHKRMLFTDKAGNIAGRPQPYGWDEWMSTSPYRHAVVEGSKITITFVQGTAAGAGNSFRMIAGFSTLSEEGGVAFIPNFNSTFGNINTLEVADMINNKIIKNPKTLSITGDGVTLPVPQTFVHTYSRKRLEKHMKRIGTYTDVASNISNYQLAKENSPAFNPKVRFIIADVGSVSSTIAFNCFVTMDYTIRLMNPTMPDKSVV